ncbi:MAG: iron-containing alcohol dehydrogenase [Oscillospiraceae bacterium]|nr:iron-containing alcohol dehydrogenase [Oscillospiraceae bacterium]
MENFVFCSPTEFVFGKGQERETGRCIRKYGGTNVLVLYGGGSAVRSGLLDRIRGSLKEAGISWQEIGGVQPNPIDTKVYEGIELCRAQGIDFILAVGGGSVIDTAKAIAAGVPYDGDFWDFYCGKAEIQAALPVGTVLTIAAAGSEGSGDSVITKTDGMLKRGAGSPLLRARFSVMNPELTQTLPAYQTACGATDIMAHVFERYFTNTPEVEVTDRLCEAVLLTMVKETPRAIAEPENYDARANIMWAGMVAHNNIVGVGRQQDWNSHGLEHELSALYQVAHGAGLAVIMPAWMEYVMPHNPMRFAQMATRVFGCQMNFAQPEETAKAGIRAFRRFLHGIGMPISFSELGAEEADIPKLVGKLGIPEGKKRAGFMELSAEDAANIYRIAAHAVLE